MPKRLFHACENTCFDTSSFSRFSGQNGLWRQKGQNVPKPAVSRLWKRMFWHLIFFTFFWPKRPLEAKTPKVAQNGRFALMNTHVLTPHLFHIFLAKTAETYLGSVDFGSFVLKLRVFTRFCSPPGLQFNKNHVKREGFCIFSSRLQDAPRYAALKLRVFTRFCSPPGLQCNKNLVKHE